MFLSRLAILPENAVGAGLRPAFEGLHLAN